MSNIQPGDEVQSLIYTFERSEPPFGSPNLWCWCHLWIKCAVHVDTSLYCPLVFTTAHYRLEMVRKKTAIQMRIT